MGICSTANSPLITSNLVLSNKQFTECSAREMEAANQEGVHSTLYLIEAKARVDEVTLGRGSSALTLTLSMSRALIRITLTRTAARVRV